VQGWPKFQLQVYQEDIFGRNELVGYGFVHVPCAPGTHDLECSCWRPMSSSWNDEVNAFFVGGNPQLKAVDMISSNIDRCVRLLWRSSDDLPDRLTLLLLLLLLLLPAVVCAQV
jgi:hypothetical protein